jgi:acetoin utilization deacetylase AcuC-like enzyme
MEDILSDASLQRRLSDVVPRPAARKELQWVHTAEHLDRVEKSAEKALTSFDFDTQATEQSFEAASLAVGGIFNLLDEIWAGRASRGFACVRPPGHHAEPNKAMGFCLFNNAALGARYLKETYGVRKVMIVDIDVHHGNGTQAVFYDAKDVLYVSMHQFPAFPGTGNFGEVGGGEGEGFTVNIPMGKGHGDADFSKVIYFMVNPLAQAYEPDMILVSCGFDLYYRDPLGGMRGTGNGYGLMTFFLLGIAEKVCQGRIAFIMEGGYSLRGIRECGLRVMQELCGASSVSGRSIDKVVGASPKRLAALAKAMAVQSPYWKILR